MTYLFQLLEGAGVSLIHALTRGELCGLFQSLYRMPVVEDVAGSHKLVGGLSLQGILGRLVGKR